VSKLVAREFYRNIGSIRAVEYLDMLTMKQTTADTTPDLEEPTDEKKKKTGKNGAKGTKLPKVPLCSAVTLTVEDSKYTYAEAITRAREQINLSDLGIPHVQPRRAITGGLILEIPDDEGGYKASMLGERMAEVLQGFPIKVSVPRKTAEMKLTRLDDSVTPDEVVAAVAQAGNCGMDEVTAGELQRTPWGVSSLWLRCPLAAARKICEPDDDDVAKSMMIVIGWSAAKIHPLPKRRLRCFKCLKLGHVRQECKSTVDRSDRCYRCGKVGHQARGCLSQKPCCPLCADLGVPATHRMGSRACKPPPR
jgi:hypothetical protein